MVASAASNSYPSDSIFWLKSEWVNQDAKKVKLSDLADSPSIVSMVFLSCKYTCPLTIQDMREMESLLEKAKLSKYRLVLISIDPENDTPQAMRAFMSSRKLNPQHWTILSSDPKSIREFAATLGFNYKKDEAIKFAHSMLTWVFDQDGVLRFTRSARRESIHETIEAFLKLSKSSSKTP